MTLEAERVDPPVKDAVSRGLKWGLLAVAIAIFALMAWNFIVKLRPLFPQAIDRLVFRKPLPASQAAG